MKDNLQKILDEYNSRTIPEDERAPTYVFEPDNSGFGPSKHYQPIEFTDGSDVNLSSLHSSFLEFLDEKGYLKIPTLGDLGYKEFDINRAYKEKLEQMLLKSKIDFINREDEK